MNLAMKIIKSILNIIMTIIIIVGSVFVILFCIGIQPYVVESGSMQPDIPTGSLCFINKKVMYTIIHSINYIHIIIFNNYA